MKKLVRNVVRFCLISSLGTGVMRGQEWILYKLDSAEAPYVLSRHYPISDKIDASEVIMAKTFNIKPLGSWVELTLSNAIVLKTEIPRRSSSNTVVRVKQQVIKCSALTMSFNKTERIIFEGRMLEIGQYSNAAKDTVPKVIYEGEAAEQYLKTNANGPGLPPDYGGH